MNPAFASTFFSASDLRARRTLRECVQRNTTRLSASASIDPLTPNATNSTGGLHGKHVGVVVVDHGSRRASANSMLDDVVSKVRSRTSYPVFPAHMELATPTISDAIEACSKHGVSHVVVVPFFLAPGRHVTHDVPSLVQQAVEKHHPNMSFSIRPHIGAHTAVIDAVVDHATLDDSAFHDIIQHDSQKVV